MQLFRRSIIGAAVDGTAVANSAAETTLLPAAAKYTFPKNFWDYVGRDLHIYAAGRISTLNGAGVGTLTLRVKFGAIVLLNGGAINLNQTAQVNATWELMARLRLRAIGTNGNMIGVGRWTSRAIVGGPAAAAGGVESILLPNTAPAVGSNFDTTAEQQLDLTGQFSVADANNSIQLHDFEAAVSD